VTKLKFKYLSDYSFKERLILLNVVAIGSALVTMRKINTYNAWGYSFKAIGNATIAYAMGGLIIAP